MKKYVVLILTTIGLGVATTVFTTLIIMTLNQYSDKKDEVAQLLDSEKRLGNAAEWVPGLFNWTSDDVIDQHRTLEYEAKQYYDRGVKYGFMMGGVALLYALINLLAYRKSVERIRMWGIAMLAAALSFLYIGLQTPMMEISAYKDDVEIKILQGSDSDDWWGSLVGEEGVSAGVKGRVYFMYKNKSVLGAIHLLWEGNNKFVASCLVAFSIVFPLIKLFFSLLLFLIPKWKHALGAASVVSILGKWSMADVLVAAFFLAIFSMSQMSVGAETSSQALVGLYFFLSFVVLSIFSGFLIKKYIKQNIRPLEEQDTLDEVLDVIDN